MKKRGSSILWGSRIIMMIAVACSGCKDGNIPTAPSSGFFFKEVVDQHERELRALPRALIVNRDSIWATFPPYADRQTRAKLALTYLWKKTLSAAQVAELEAQLALIAVPGFDQRMEDSLRTMIAVTGTPQYEEFLRLQDSWETIGVAEFGYAIDSLVKTVRIRTRGDSSFVLACLLSKRNKEVYSDPVFQSEFGIAMAAVVGDGPVSHLSALDVEILMNQVRRAGSIKDFLESHPSAASLGSGVIEELHATWRVVRMPSLWKVVGGADLGAALGSMIGCMPAIGAGGGGYPACVALRTIGVSVAAAVMYYLI